MRPACPTPKAQPGLLVGKKRGVELARIGAVGIATLNCLGGFSEREEFVMGVYQF
jgi:hypothetical protein